MQVVDVQNRQPREERRYARIARFNYDYAKREYKPVGDDDVAAQHDAIERAYRGMYDMTIFNTTLNLKGRVVGFCPGNKALIPFDEAEMCEKWIDQRNKLAARNPPRVADEVVWHPELARAQSAAIVAAAHAILEIVWHILTKGTTYHELGAVYLDRRDFVYAR